MKEIVITPGEIFCIPLFMPKDDWKLKIKLTDKDLDKDFAFGRVIETSSSVTVEIFKKIGPANTEINQILESGTMFSPIKIFWDGILKKRWRLIGKTKDYDKFKDSNYSNLKMAFGVDGSFRLRDLSTQEELPINREELEKYEFAVVWFPIDLETRILNRIG